VSGNVETDSLCCTSFAKSQSRITVSDIGRNLVANIWTLDEEGTIPELGLCLSFGGTGCGIKSVINRFLGQFFECFLAHMVIANSLRLGEEDQDAYDINKLKKPVNGNVPGLEGKTSSLSDADTLLIRGTVVAALL